MKFICPVGRSSVVAFAIGVSAFGVSILSAKLTMATDPAMIRDAWRSYWANVDSCEYRCELTRAHTSTGPSVAIAQYSKGDSPPEHHKMTFSLSGKKAAHRTKGNSWDYSTKQSRDKTFAATFNGTTSKSMLMTTGKMFAHGEIIERREPITDLCLSIENLPFWLLYRPFETFDRLMYSTEEMIPLDDRVVRHGIECAEVRIPRATANWDALVYVDPQRNFLPVELVERYKRTTISVLSVKYSPNQKVDWIVSDWEYENFDDQGIDINLSGYVDSCVINEPIADSVFNLKFPESTHVVHHKGDTTTYFIQRDGKLEAMRSSDYGRVEE